MAIDIIARGLASSLLDSDGKISSEKMPTITAAPQGTQFYPVGALTNPAQLEGKTAEEILLMMLYGIVSPTLTNPSLTIELSSSVTAIVGQPTIISGTMVFDRGAISPAYGTSGYRAGLPTSYLVNGLNMDSAMFTLEITPVAGDNFIICTVEYAEGEQPLNSIGQNYENPLPAGSISAIINITGINQLYDQYGEAIEFEWFEENDGNGYQAIFGIEIDGVKQSFAVNTNQTVIGIKQFEPMTQTWMWIGGSPEASLEYFDTTLFEGESLEEENDYVLYIHNGSTTGERELRIYVE